uniref:Cytochrome c oxidase assembly protein COX16 homolog, mitochondrial n=1 Tax=Electrophorus electricus TaxID=8005 RepID=A0A4W4DQ11_ELEEL
MWTKVHKLQKSKTAKYGVPMLLMIVGSSFGLREFTQIRYDAQKIQRKVATSTHAVTSSHFSLNTITLLEFMVMYVTGVRPISGPVILAGLPRSPSGHPLGRPWACCNTFVINCFLSRCRSCAIVR